MILYVESIREMIDIGPNVPRRRNRFLRFIGNLVLRIAGWKITGSFANEPKFVLSGGPHTSNWDFIFALMSCWSLELEVHWVGKHTIFRWPFNGLFRYFGGIPVDRANPGVLYRDILNGFNNNDSFILALAPEGTRRKVKRFKPGFHRIALKAGVPIIPAGVDFAKKELEFGTPIIASSDYQADSDKLRSYYSRFTPKYPDQF